MNLHALVTQNKLILYITSSLQINKCKIMNQH